MHKHHGSCHCKNISFKIGLPKPANEYNQRACDCDFCMKHRASWVTDPEGTLVFSAREINWLHRYKQSDTSGLAEFLHCTNCGVLVGVIRQEGGKTWGAINSAVVDGVKFGEMISVSPKKLSDEDKIERWKKVWFPNVSINTNLEE